MTERAALLLVLDRGERVAAIVDEIETGVEALLEAAATAVIDAGVDEIDVTPMGATDPETEPVARLAITSDVLLAGDGIVWAAEGAYVTSTDPIDVWPLGESRIIDGLGSAIAEFDQRIGHLPVHERPERVLVLVVTAGPDDGSTVWNEKQLRLVVEAHARLVGWTFALVGLGAASEYAAALGINAVLPATEKGLPKALTTIAAAATRYLVDGEALTFTDEQRRAATSKK